MHPIANQWQLVSAGSRSPLFKCIVLFSLLAVGLSAGCASSPPKDKGFGTERMLVGAGFNFREAQTPAQFEKLKLLPQEKLIHNNFRGKMVYLYASAEGCRCLYSGDEEAYSRFQDLRRQAKLNAKMHKGWSQGNLWSSGQDWSSYINDIDSGMIPGY